MSNAGSEDAVQQQHQSCHPRHSAGLLEQLALPSIQIDLERGISNFDDCKQHLMPHSEHLQDITGMSELHAHLPAAVSMTQNSTQ